MSTLQRIVFKFPSEKGVTIQRAQRRYLLDNGEELEKVRSYGFLRN